MIHEWKRVGWPEVLEVAAKDRLCSVHGGLFVSSFMAQDIPEASW